MNAPPSEIESLVPEPGWLLPDFYDQSERSPVGAWPAPGLNPKELFLDQNQNRGQQTHNRRRVTIALMVSHVNHSATLRDFLVPAHFQLHSGQSKGQFRPQDSNSINRIRIPSQNRVQQIRRTHQQNISQGERDDKD